jgi:hypothetical protein
MQKSKTINTLTVDQHPEPEATSSLQQLLV